MGQPGMALPYLHALQHWKAHVTLSSTFESPFDPLVQVSREKAVYHILNMLSIDVTKKCLVGEGWCPVAAKPKVGALTVFSAERLLPFHLSKVDHLWWAFEQIQDALQRAAFDSNSQVGTIFQVLHTREMPPTYFITNKFTEPFQGIVDAYG